MSVLNENISIKIREVQFLSWSAGSVKVAVRPYHALAIRISGSADFTCGSLNVSTNTNDVFYMPANRSYKAVYPKPNELIVIHFDSDLISKAENFQLKNSHIISMLFHELYDVWNKKNDGYYYAALSLMGEILENIAIQQSPVLRARTLEAFENAVEFMEKSYTSCDFSINEMIEKSFMSDTYFRKLFFNKFSMTPVKYLTHKRLMYAEKLLSTGKHSIKAVAEMSGFSDVKYFSRIVKNEYGVPPSRLYRNIKSKV